MNAQDHRTAAETFSGRAEDCLADAESARRRRDRKHLMRRAAVYAHLALAHSNLALAHSNAATDALIADMKKPSAAVSADGRTPNPLKGNES